MANRNFDGVQALGKGVTLIAGNFAVDGAGAVTAQVPTVANAAPFTVTKPAATTGQYLITLQDSYNAVLAVLPSVLKSAGANVYKADVAAYSASSGTVTLQVHDTTSGAAVDPATIEVDFLLVLKNSSVWP